MECIICLQESKELEIGFCPNCLKMVEDTREAFKEDYDCEINFIDERIKCDKQCRRCKKCKDEK